MALTELVNALRQQAIKIALEAVDSCADADAIIKYYRGGTA